MWKLESGVHRKLDRCQEETKRWRGVHTGTHSLEVTLVDTIFSLQGGERSWLDFEFHHRYVCVCRCRGELRLLSLLDMVDGHLGAVGGGEGGHFGIGGLLKL